MADTSSNTPLGAPVSTPAPAPSATRSTSAPAKSTSKISLLLAFAAGAAASWIIMQATEDDQPTQAPSSISRKSSG